MKSTIFIAGSVLVLVATASWLFATREVKETQGITVYGKGQRTRIGSASPYYRELEEEVEAFLNSSNSALYEGVKKSVISDITNRESAVEVIYGEPKLIHMTNFPGTWIKVDRVLIPLAGYYAPRTVFYGYKSYSSGPFVNETGAERIKSIKATISKLSR